METVNLIKKILRPFVPQIVLERRKMAVVERLGKKEIADWQARGCPVPPPHIVKQRTIGEYQRKYGYNILVETGTFNGDMVEAQKTNFKKIISIELGVDLFVKAQQRFAKDKHVRIVQGDSGKMLPNILKSINEPAIFWLDGHYSSGPTAKGDKECPIWEELDAVFNAKMLNHILLIDDARHFVGTGDYPTIDALTKYITSKNGAYHVEVKHDIIRYELRETVSPGSSLYNEGVARRVAVA